MSADLCFQPATALATLMRNRELSPVELIEALLVRISALNPALNAYVTVDTEQVLADARRSEQALLDGDTMGRLHGVPFAVKDLLYTKDLRCTGGCRAFAEFVPEHDALAVARLRAAGGILLGKTNTPEFGFKSTTENDLFGTTNNPWNVNLTAGGSSGGAGAATAAGIAPLSLGTDAGGSIRTPASFCGIVGFKPTFGRVPNGPGFGGGASIVHSGPMTRTVADSALMFDVMAGVAESDRRSVPAGESNAAASDGLRVAYSADLGYAAVDAQVSRCVESALQQTQSLGWDIDTAPLALDDPQAVFNTIIRAENYVANHALVAQHGDQIDADMRAFTENGANISAFEYLAAMAARDKLCMQLAAVFERFDLLITPTLAVPPFAHGERPVEVAGRAISGMSWLSFTYPFNLTGNPALSIPAGWTDDNLPIGLQIIGPRFSDNLVLRAGAAVEAVLGWTKRRPPLAT
jgi:aspartyl-tRNA(Asn)/glutamyl-tRNA(Gln) amidotransferase subunit A